MNGDRWRKIQEIFDAAVQLDSSEQGRFLQQACGGDPELRKELETLLRSDASGGGFLANAVGKVAQHLLQSEDHLPAQTRVGAYRVLRLLGQGGMGAVYLAERADGQFERQVAIKVVRSEAVHRSQLLTRLQAERRILANLDHPHIARLLDGGATKTAILTWSWSTWMESVWTSTAGRGVCRWTSAFIFSARFAALSNTPMPIS